MKVLVLGAGVVGTCTAWYLAARGHEVTVVERRDGAGLETSFANGGQISVSHSEPWANPDAPIKLLKWLWREDSPLLFRLRMDPHQWSWGLKFFYECMPWRTPENSRRMVTLSAYSREKLAELRRTTSIDYDALERGILHYFTDVSAFEGAKVAAPELRKFGLQMEAKTADECVKVEPALAQFRDKIVGAMYTPDDESGDAHKFTVELARMAAQKGVQFLYGREIVALHANSAGMTGVTVKQGSAKETQLTADAYVMALGSYSPLLTRKIGVDLDIYPAKGYSATATVIDASKAPRVSITDDAAKIVFSRLGNRLRIAGTAELSGYSTELNRVRCDALIRRAQLVFPEAADYNNATFWTGLRPSTPSNVPYIGRTKYSNLFLNTGHGTLGWTMACGSGAALADLISAKEPEVDFKWST